MPQPRLHLIQASLLPLGVLMLAATLGAQPASRPADILTIEETIGSVFVLQMEGRPWHLYSRANAGAREQVCRILENASLERYHPAAWHILGYIGDDATVQWLEGRVLSLQGVLSSPPKDSAYAMFDALGLMARRDIKAAEALVDRMADPAYWQKARFQWVAEAQLANSLSFSEQTMTALCDGYAICGRQDIQGKVSAFVNALPEGLRKTEMLRRTSAERLKSVASVVLGEEQPLTQEERRTVAKLFNGDMENPLPVKEEPRRAPAPTTLEKGFSPGPLSPASSALVKEGFAAYQTFTAAFARADYESVLDRFISDGEPKSVKRMKSQWKELKSALDLERKLLGLPAVRDAKCVDWTLLQSETDHFQSLTPEGSPVEPRARIQTILTFKLEGTEGLFAEIVGPGDRTTNTFAPDGSLLVLMMKIDGKWYWNPFGF